MTVKKINYLQKAEDVIIVLTFVVMTLSAFLQVCNRNITRNGAPSGYATIVVVMCFMFSLLFLVVGIIGEYIAILFSEMKDRPIYIVEDTVNLEER